MVGHTISGHSGLTEPKEMTMRKIIVLVACFLMASVAAQADMTQNGRQPKPWDQAVSSVNAGSGKDYTDNTTAFANVVATGNTATGNSGYIALMATDSAGIARTYYLWVDASTSTGVLRMASLPNISAYSSFPYGDWRGPNFGAGYKVSSQ